jgi:hypothetical protein
MTTSQKGIDTITQENLNQASSKRFVEKYYNKTQIHVKKLSIKMKQKGRN